MATAQTVSAGASRQADTGTPKKKQAVSTEPANASNFTMLFGQTEGTDVVNQGGSGVHAPASGFDVFFGGNVTIVQDATEDMAGALATASGPVGVPAPALSRAAAGASGVLRDEQDTDKGRTSPRTEWMSSDASAQSQADAASPEEPRVDVDTVSTTNASGRVIGGSSIPQGVHLDAAEGGGGGGEGGGGGTGPEKSPSYVRSDTWGSGIAFDEAAPDDADDGQQKKPQKERVRRVQVLDGLSTVSIDKLHTALVALGDSPGMVETGKRVVELLCQHELVDEVRILSPNAVGYTGAGSERVRQVVADYEAGGYEAECDRVDVAFSFLGHTREEVGVDGFWPVMDSMGPEGLDLVQRINGEQISRLAKVLAGAGCKHMHLVSAQDANPDSILAFLKARGEAEEATKLAGFSRVSVYRPAFLKGKRHNSLTNAVVSTLTIPTLEAFAPHDASINIETAAKAVVSNAFARSAQSVEVLENADMLKKGGSEGDGWIRFPELDAMDWEEVWSTATARRRWRDEAQEGERDAEEDVVLGLFDFGGGGDDEEGGKGKRREIDIDMDDEKEGWRVPRESTAVGTDEEWDFKFPEIEFPEISVPFLGDGGEGRQGRGAPEGEDSWISSITLPDLKDIVPSFSKESREMEVQTEQTINPDSGKVLIYRRV